MVGDNEICQFIPDTVSTDHTGTLFGNKNSIGVERLICEGVNYEHATHNQAKLVATLMLKYNIPIENVYTHKQMQTEFGNGKTPPKNCPQRLLAGFRGNVQDFKHEVERCFLYGWFFEELLNDEQKKQIPGLMEAAKRKEILKNAKEKAKKRSISRTII